jgi:hypothetical protein
MQKNILWVSRHTLSKIQERQLLSLHGNKLSIEKRDIRFSDQKHFLDFLREHHERYFVYSVVPEDWKEEAIRSGFSLGTAHKPYHVKDQKKKRLVSKIEFHHSCDVVEKKQTSKVFGAKGYCNKN